jgi:L-threonylcarbamoyladenylate synthase
LSKASSKGKASGVMEAAPTLEKSLCNVAQAADRCLSGGVIVFPTETVYGLGASIEFPKAIARIYEIKARPSFNPLICHIAEWSHLDALVETIPDAARVLMEAFWPGPLTLVLKKKPQVSELVTGGLDQVAVRWPKHPMAQDLIRRVGHPIAAPSANVSGRLSPTRLEHVWLQLGNKVDGYLDGGPAESGLESTVLGWENDMPVLLRPGAIGSEAIEKVLQTKLGASASKKIQSPGQLLKHYAPLKPIQWEDVRRIPPHAALVTLQALPSDSQNYETVCVLSAEGDLQAAATQFFETLHALERSNVSLIVARPFPMEGLGVAMNDRLHRAIQSSRLQR